MAIDVILPRVDMDMATGSISRWYVEDGGRVEKGAVLFEIETDKAAMEIDAPASGRLHRLAEDDGAAIPVGSIVAWILGEGEAVPEDKAATAAETAPAPAPDAAAPVATTAAAAAPVSPPVTNGTPRATPLARRLARERRLDLSALSGSGPHGRIQARDVADCGARTCEPAAKVSAEARPPLAPTPPAAPSVATAPAAAMPAGPRSGPLNGVWLRKGEGVPLVLVHGFGGEAGSWRPLVSAMKAARPVLAIDLPGHGLSPEGATDFDAIVAAVGDTLLAEGVSDAHLVGHSLGAAVATALADGGAVDARSLFLLSPGGLGPEIDGSFLQGFTRARSQASLSPWMRMLVHDPESLPAGFVAATARARESASLVEAQARLADALFPDATQVFSIRPALARLGVPVRVVFGLADRIIPARHAAGLPGMVAVHLFPGVGHMPQVEVRDAVARLLEQHLG